MIQFVLPCGIGGARQVALIWWLLWGMVGVSMTEAVEWGRSALNPEGRVCTMV